MEPMQVTEKEKAIQQQMEETRASLTEKLETLEQKVVGTVEEATTVASDTVEAVKDTVAAVNETVKESVETVKDWFDIEAHVQNHPWLVVGGSVALGYCLGTFAPSSNGSTQAQPTSLYHPPQPQPAQQPSMLSQWAPEISRLKNLALGVLFGTAREVILSSVPPHVGEELKGVIDSVTRKLGGEPLPSSDLAALQPQKADQNKPWTGES